MNNHFITCGRPIYKTRKENCREEEEELYIAKYSLRPKKMLSEETSSIIPYKANRARFVDGSGAILPVNES